jgi:hypothetical protein
MFRTLHCFVAPPPDRHAESLLHLDRTERGARPSFFLTIDTVHSCVLLKQQERQAYVGAESALLYQ